MIRRLLPVAAAAGLLLAPAGLAHAATEPSGGRIQQVTGSNGNLTVVFSVAGLAAGQSIDPTSVRLSVNGAPVASTAKLLSAGAAPVQQVAVLAIDTSGSMAGAGLRGAKDAANAFLGAVPSSVKVGLVTFSATPHLAVAPTTNRNAVRAAVAKLSASGETALYDGVSLALQEAGSTGARTIVVLSDGADTVSHTSRSTVEKAITASKAVVDAVAFNTDATQTKVLQSLAADGGGRVLTASVASALAQAFAEAARDVANTVVISAKVPPALAGKSANVSVSATAGGTPVGDTVFTLLPTAATPTATNPGVYGARPVAISHSWFTSRSAALVGAAALFAGLLVLLVFGAGYVNRDRASSTVRRRLSIYSLTGKRHQQEQEHETTVLGQSGVARSAVELAGRIVSKRGMDQVLGDQLESAGIPMKPAEWLVIHMGATLGGALLLFLLGGGRALPAVLGLVIGFVLPLAVLNMKAGKRTAQFLEQLPDTLQLIAGSLRAGHSLPQAIDAVVREGNQPIAGEFQRAIVETRLGVPIEDALDNIAARMKNKDFEWTVMAIRIQREVGGNLAEVLTTVAATLRERERLRRQVRVLSAEGRLSAWILGLLPVLIAVYFVLVRPNYIRILYSDRIGVAMLVLGALLMTVAVFWLRKVVRVEV